MKKIFGFFLSLLLVAICCIALADVWVNEASFPDDKFRDFIIDYFDLPPYDHPTLTDDMISETKKLDLSQKGIGDLTGIGYFSSLEELDCHLNNLRELNVNGCTALTRLDCSDNRLRSLTIKKNGNLIYLKCCANNLTELDLEGNESLQDLICQTNSLNALDVSNNPELTWIFCYENNLSALDVSGHTKLEYLKCNKNRLTSVNISGCTVLKEFECYENQLNSLDLSGMQKLWRLECQKNNLTELDLSHNSELLEVLCFNNELIKLNIRNCSKLYDLRCFYNKLSKLNISSCPYLVRLVKEIEPDETRYYPSEITYFEWSDDDAELSVDKMVEVIIENEPLPIASITLNKTNATLTRTSKKTKPTLQLKATVSPADADNPSVTWSSSNSKVAKVDANGKVTALKAGEAVITCTADDGSGVSAQCTVTVKNRLITKLVLNKKKATLKKGKTLQLKVKTFKPADALSRKVKWTTSNKKVATVDKNGKVKAIGKGTCYIICTAADGSGVIVKCKITVK